MPVNVRDKAGTYRDKQGQAGTSRDKQGQGRDGQGQGKDKEGQTRTVCPYLSLSFPVCPCLLMSFPVCPCLSMSVPVCPCPCPTNHLFLLQTNIMLSIACLPWQLNPPGIISFFSMAPSSWWFFLASFLIFHPSGFISFSYSMSSTGPLGCLLLLASFCLFHPSGIISFFLNDALN